VPEPEGADEVREDEPAEASPASEPQETSAVVVPMDVSAVEAFGQRARLAEDRLAEVLAAYRQLKGDQEGQRERAARAIERRFDQRHEKLIVKFIDILDGFDRALAAAEQTYAGAPLIEGLILVRTQLLQTLRDEGLDRIPVLGLPFDPHVSEAMGTEPVADPDQHHMVVKEYQRGYRFNDRVVRPSRVVVGQCAEQLEVALQAEQPAAATDEPLLAAYDQGEGLRPTPDDASAQAESLAPEASTAVLIVTPLTEEDGAPSVEEIVARGESEDAPASEETSKQP
jgi:molecular chaperone GrpE